MENNENSVLCSTCAGKCCKKYAGFYHPEQVLELLQNLKRDKRLGVTHQIDCYDGTFDTDYKDVFMIRPCHKNTFNQTLDRSWGGTCVNLTENGCKYPFEERPIVCQSLAPSSDFICKNGYKKIDMAMIWKPYQHYFEGVI